MWTKGHPNHGHSNWESRFETRNDGLPTPGLIIGLSFGYDMNDQLAQTEESMIFSNSMLTPTGAMPLNGEIDENNPLVDCSDSIPNFNFLDGDDHNLLGVKITCERFKDGTGFPLEEMEDITDSIGGSVPDDGFYYTNYERRRSLAVSTSATSTGAAGYLNEGIYNGRYHIFSFGHGVLPAELQTNWDDVYGGAAFITLPTFLLQRPINETVISWLENGVQDTPLDWEAEKYMFPINGDPDENGNYEWDYVGWESEKIKIELKTIKKIGGQWIAGHQRTIPIDNHIEVTFYTPEDEGEELTGEAECIKGDLTGDGGWNVLDIVALANIILEAEGVTDSELCVGDLNGDTAINVLDLTVLVNCVFFGTCPDL